VLFSCGAILVGLVVVDDSLRNRADESCTSRMGIQLKQILRAILLRCYIVLYL
jgi:hypothetical protein